MVGRNINVLNQKSKIKNQKSMLAPLRFESFLRPMVWGGRRLGEVLGKALPTKEAYGESWEISDHPLHRSVVAVGPRTGQTFRHLMESERIDLLGEAAAGYEVFPWLVKFLDARDWLSVQVHPDEEAVLRLWPGEGAKTEAWFVLAAEPGSRIYAGLEPGTDKAQLRAALQAGTVAKCLHHFTPRAGDCIFLPAGTVHAVGGGVLLAEIQQTSDATFRLFDWNRRDAHGKSRSLHIDEALACIDWMRGPVKPIRTSALAGAPVGGGYRSLRRTLVECPFFQVELVRESAPLAWGGEGRFQVWIVLAGKGHWEVHGQEEEIQRGQAWLLPAAMSPTWCRPDPELDFLLCTLPEQV
jgi:mannose-6-phosphate isomerase